MTERIRWEQETAADINGYVGIMDTPMFQLWRTPCDSGDAVIGDWVLSSGIPKLVGHDLRASRDLGPLKAEAERWLEEFTSSIGAVFPDAALKLADDWEAEAMRLDQRIEAHKSPEARQGLSVRASAHEDCARELREAIRAGLTGQEDEEP